MTLIPKGTYKFDRRGQRVAVAAAAGGAVEDDRIQQYFQYGFIDKRMQKNEIGYLYENQMKEVFDAFLNTNQEGQGVTTLPCAGATCALPDLGLVSGEFDGEAQTVSILDSQLNLCALELKTSGGADFGQIAFEGVIVPQDAVRWRIASKSKTAAGSPNWSKAVFDGVIIPHLEEKWPLQRIAAIYATPDGPALPFKNGGFNIVSRQGEVLFKGMRPMGIGEDITTFTQMLDFFSNVKDGRWLTFYNGWYMALPGEYHIPDELTSQQRNSWTRILWNRLKTEAIFYYGPSSDKFIRETPAEETENQLKKRIGAAKTEAKRHATG